MVKVIELFSGIGAQTQALKNIGVEHEVVAIAEIDRYAIANYTKLHGETFNLGDVSKVEPVDIPRADLVTYSFPCQDISICSAQDGLAEDSNTRSALLWECKKVIQAAKPKYLLMENVKNLLNTRHLPHYLKWNEFLSSIGYTTYYQVLNACDYGLPQNRERVIAVSILGGQPYEYQFPKAIQLETCLEDFLLEENKARYCYPMNIQNTFQPKPYELGATPKLTQVGDLLGIAGHDILKRVYHAKGIAPTLTTCQGGNTQAKVMENDIARKLSPKEYWLLMGFTEEQFNKVSDTSNSQLYKQAGNSIAVPVLEAVFRSLFLTK